MPRTVLTAAFTIPINVLATTTGLPHSSPDQKCQPSITVSSGSFICFRKQAHSSSIAPCNKTVFHALQIPSAFIIPCPAPACNCPHKKRRHKPPFYTFLCFLPCCIQSWWFQYSLPVPALPPVSSLLPNSFNSLRALLYASCCRVWFIFWANSSAACWAFQAFSS